MELLLRILKVAGVLLFIFVLVVLCAPTLKGGAFVLIHFVTTLTPGLLAQGLFLALAFCIKPVTEACRAQARVAVLRGHACPRSTGVEQSRLRC